LAVAISTPTAAPVIAAVRLRAGRAGSGKGAASIITEAEYKLLVNQMEVRASGFRRLFEKICLVYYGKV